MTRVDRKEFVGALRVAVEALPGKRDGSPVLQNVHLSTEGGWLRLEATDLTTFVRVPVSADGEIRPALVNARDLLAFVRDAEGPTVAIDVADGEFYAETASARWAVPNGDPEDFPELPSLGAHDTSGGWLPADELRHGLEQVRWASSTDAARWQLNSVAIEHGDFFASDGKRLAEYDMANLPGKGIIPRSGVAVLVRFLKFRGDREVFWDMDPVALRVASPNSGEFYSRLIEGQFPDYVSMIPTDFDATIIADAKPLRKAVKAVAAGLPKEKRIVSLEARSGSLTVRSATGDVQVQGALASGLEAIWTFSVEFLDDVLKAVGPRATVELHLQKERGAAVLKCKGLRYCFMPVLLH
jgi:DNA polymerase-3 subunit beta